MSAPSLTNYIIKRPWLKNWMMPLAQWYTNAAGYRKLGLKADDLIPEENDTVQTAIKRLPAKEAYDRIFRIRRAFQCSVSHALLPPSEQIKPEERMLALGQWPITCRGFVTFRYGYAASTLRGMGIQEIELTKEQDKEYLSPIIRQVESEFKEREDLDNLVIKR
ncbi:hypothetical protein PHISP_02137 [Aspergillus sp. HF37]|nr:hypothetical protein PHISP_02137 [Aspergillus sp. HF37]